MNFLAYLHSVGLTHKRLFTLFEAKQNYKEVWEDFESVIKKVFGNESRETQDILSKFHKFVPEKIDTIIKKGNISLIDFYHPDYPPLLKMISNPPYFLYVRGKISSQDNFFSIVGSRKMTPYAKKAGESMIGELSEYFTIVSGGAGGCDTLAHKLCVENNKKTIVVFGTGIDQIYPVGNAALFEKVVQNDGALVSVFPIGTTGSAFTFPVRNEIVAGMSRGVLILEAAESSGTLITAQLALDQGKDVFAVPGDIFHPNFSGTNRLIQSGHAKLITKTDDILEEYQYKAVKKDITFAFQNTIQSDIYELLKYNLSLSIDELLEKTSFSYPEISLNVSMMELLGAIKKDMFGKYERIG